MLDILGFKCSTSSANQDLEYISISVCILEIEEILIISEKLGLQEKYQVSSEFTGESYFNISRQPQIIKRSLISTSGPY